MEVWPFFTPLPDFKYKGIYSGSNRSCGGCSTVVVRAVSLAHVASILENKGKIPSLKHDLFKTEVFMPQFITYNIARFSRTVRDSQLGRASLRVVGVSIGASDGADRDGVATVGISIKVAVVAIPASVSCSKHKDAALAASPIRDTVDEGIEQDLVGSFHGDTVVLGTPAARVDLRLVESIVDRLGLLNIGDLSRQDTNSRHFGVPCHAHTAEVVPGRCNLSCTACSVVVVPQSWQGKSARVVEIMRASCILRYPKVS